MDYHNLYLFIKVVEKGSLLGAARALGVPSSTLSRRLQQLEQQLGYQLIYRSARKLSLSEAGQLFYERCKPLFEGLEESTQELQGKLTGPMGRLRVTAPANLAESVLTPLLFGFMEEHPGIDLDYRVSNQHLDLKEEGIDLAFRIGEVRIPDWVSRTLHTSRFFIVAAPQLLEQTGALNQLADLEKVPLLMSRRHPVWQLVDEQGNDINFTGPTKLIYDDLSVALQAVIRGMGVACLPDYTVEQALKKGQLQPVLQELTPHGRKVQMVYPHRQHLPAKVRLLINFMAENYPQTNAADLLATN